MKYTICSNCGGHGIVNGDGGDPVCCRKCKGDGTERARDARGRFIAEEDAREEARNNGQFGVGA